MNEKRTKEIVKEVYTKAKINCISNAKNALAIHVENELLERYKKSLSYKTIERAFDKYIDGKKIGPPLAESVNLMCVYLGFENFTDYVRRRQKWKWKVTIGISLAAILISLLVLLPKFSKNSNTSSISRNGCMTWADSIYVTASCDSGPYSKYETPIVPMNQNKMKNFKKVEVDAAYSFFTEDGKPLIWYHKKNDRELEYFTAPGLHPITGKTLDEITEYMIEKYVPIHSNKSDSFIKEN
ncbi:hypothetical protein [Flagellimonas myxillae]|uniref:hypothetical protein n=1 Tax=Flagellimonas myxillae TaxID=2942214 RepID=UPI00201F3B5A|nr:hypothetical protein [Muricauda myxillae]MCL6267784.1 hypothetical protein [Muricauda myxillae]